MTTKRILIPDKICDEHCNRQECRWNWYLRLQLTWYYDLSTNHNWKLLLGISVVHQMIRYLNMAFYYMEGINIPMFQWQLVMFPLKITNCRITLESMDPNHGHKTKSKTLPCNTHQKKGSLYFIDRCSCLVVSYHLQVVYGNHTTSLHHCCLIDNKITIFHFWIVRELVSMVTLREVSFVVHVVNSLLWSILYFLLRYNHICKYI